MDFSLNQEQEMFRNYVRKYLDDVGQTKVAREFTEGNTSSFQALYAGLAELGCASVNVSEENGGMGLGQLDLVPILEETGRALLPGLYLETNALAVPLLEKFGTEEQKAKYLSAIASGDHTFTVAWLEPNGNYKPSNVKLHGTLQDDVLTLNGVKSLVPDVELASSLLVLVRTSEGQGAEGISLVIVDCDDVSLHVEPQKNMDETRLLAEVTFNDVQVSSQQILGTIDHGWDVLQEGLLSFNAALCSSIVGSMEKIVETAVEYANIREQFNQPIGRFQAIKHRLVDMKMDLETARSLAYYANWAIESNADDKVEAVSSARLFATEAFIKVASQSIQIHGGIGFTEELDCHLYVKRARFYENYLGSTQQYYEQAAVALGW
ncbi:acyl-CoA/acyl-ACP dehydrogenase [Lysinibacillus sp. CD3-6]|uniref:acyl-CoA dehydrogenase family protein n=1 Tax=Lysinibacillus sp. CD3-6 TaxID=2892541 RepID=UPI00116EB1D5|nr:acyl-CoA dehydrogenase family protein [Lysinibacillus sp. CD3-6]UED78140.1 acyl-CoA/acyl-ACP dehydrogenase [Lysinibacillus sp. CD3-6]